MSEVKINHVYKRYGSITVVDDFNLEVKDVGLRQNDDTSHGRGL